MKNDMELSKCKGRCFQNSFDITVYIISLLTVFLFGEGRNDTALESEDFIIFQVPKVYLKFSENLYPKYLVLQLQNCHCCYRFLSS